MKHLLRSKSVHWRALLTGLFVLALLGLTPQAALAQDPVPVISSCLSDALNCTAEDFGGVFLESQESLSGCIDHDGDGTLEMNFNITLRYQSSTTTRYDIGSMLALDGNPVQRLINADPTLNEQVCLRDYLPPPLTSVDPAGANAWPVAGEFWNGDITPQIPLGDTCGDLPPRDHALRTYTDVWVACVDNYNATTNTLGSDGQIDMNLCVFYDNNAGTACDSVYMATAGTTAKCGCGYYVTFPFTPTAVSLKDFGARSSQGYLLGGLGLLVAIGASGSYWLYRKQTKTAA